MRAIAPMLRKHSLLIALVRALQHKESALTLIDTHAGCGLYDLDGEAARRTGEAEQGVLRAFADQNPCWTTTVPRCKR